MNIRNSMGLFFIWAQPAVSGEMTFDIIYANHTNIVVASGEITANTPAAFQAFLETEPFDGFSFFIDLNSPGGNLMGGIELGRMIREEGLTTRVASYRPRQPEEDYWFPREEPGICMSACALAFLGGEDRQLSEYSALGFHQFSSAGNGSGEVADVYELETTTQFIAALVHEYIESMGISATLFSRMSITAPEEMFIPTRQELEAYNIIPTDAFSNFVLEPYGEGVIAIADFPQNVEGRNIVSRITAYCRDGTPFLLLSQPQDFPPLSQRWLESANEMLDGFSLWLPPGNRRIDYPPSNVKFLIGGEAVAEISLNAEGVSLVLMGADGVVQLPGAVGTSMAFEVRPTESDQRILNGAFTLCISGEPNAQREIPALESELDLDSRLINMYNDYLTDWSDSNLIAIDAMERAYGSEVRFYGNIISREELLSEKREFAERWPQRVYAARPASFQVSCSDTLCIVAAMIDWQAHSPFRDETARGEAWYELGFDRGTGLIIFENGESRRL